MGKKLKHLIGYKIRGTRVVPITIKITGLFIILLLLSNFTTNYINLVLNRGVQIKLMNQLLVRDLKDLHTFSNNQYEIFTYNRNREEAVGYISERALKELKGKNSVFLGLSSNGEILFSASPGKSPEKKDLSDLNMKINELKTASKNEGSLNFMIGEREFFGVSKYNQKWDAYLVRVEEVSEFYYQTRVVFTRISIIIILITIVCGALGIYLVSHILRFVQRMTDQIMEMRKAQKFGLVDLDDAPNDDITLLGMSFNSLSSNIDNLMTIFRKFVTADVVKKAYKEKQIRLEGASKDLTILFSDIKQFTNMTEVLGTDIISLINMHYQQVIKEIPQKEGIVGSLIGDALLAIFGTFDDLAENKSVEALQAAYRIQEVAADLRKKMIDKREDIIKQRGSLTRAEEIVYRAVLIEVGVGIDGGEVFYGNIGSNERMTNTVIGDNVNSSSRLEGLTRIYKVPVICSEYIRNDASEFTDSYYFHELDIVRVKGKNAGKRIFWPVETEILDDALENNLKSYNSALKAYYKGDWISAERDFAVSHLPAADVFIQRISGKTPPEGVEWYMDNDRKVKKDVVNQSRKIFLNWKNLEIGNKNLYDLEKNFSATKKNKNYLVIITILIFLIVFVGTAYAVTRYIQESGRIVPIEIKDFEDVNLKDILDVAKNYEQKLVRARNELKTLEAEHKNAVSEVRSQRERETQIVMESQNSEEEKRKSIAALRRKESRTAAALDSEYGKKIEEKEKEISEIEKSIASYDATVVEQARKQEEILNNQQKMAELEMENTVGMYEERISDIEKRRDNEISSLKKDNRRLVSVLKSRHKKELDDMYKKYNPVFENEKYLKILSDKRAPSLPEYAAEESVIILDKNNIISAAEIRMVRKDASDVETILERLKGIEYENSVPQAFDRLFERGSSIISRYEKSWEKSADSVKSRNEQLSSFSSAFDFYISETGVSGYILFIESSDRISVYMNRILEIAEGDKGYVFRSDSEMIGEIEFYHDNERLLAKLINSDSGKETEDAVEIKPFDRILVQVE